ncbi:hypothetical protein TREMEDRAFT_61395 [Tremella mesenterica DSM 1558]|uniref:uncharacterized protein n=1 Tax=Tremella mesenterica (strain ATCC 24925 / CBS 8224 / DSM 1558 / NBRC 9311 / NRRL Y-6157 / RJB 2259-6 / UBC 559-6) TaxID=578456 RepID=UPI0003F491AB|nr:uncharacterized protein TREMEDRAFT_61395 [Tremella mesenterica DSM 1558]EIW70883.1 hypothetical protein TREMEDRAFT_61395 [Tremella mesenterica DSM 1558]
MVTRKQLASLKKATEASANKRRRSGSQGRRSGSQVPPVRSPPPVAVAGPSKQRVGQGRKETPNPRHLTPFPHDPDPPADLPIPSTDAPFPSTPLREVSTAVEYQTPRNKQIKGGVEASGPPYREGPLIVVPKPGGRQNSYHDIVLQAMDVSSNKVQNFIHYLRLWKSTKAESTRAKVDLVLSVLGTEQTIVGYASEPCNCCEDMLSKPSRWQDFTKKWPCLVPVIRFSGSEQYHICGHCYWCLVDRGTCSFAVDSRIGPRDQLKFSMTQWKAMYTTLDKAMANAILLSHRYGVRIDEEDAVQVAVKQQVNDVYSSVLDLCVVRVCFLPHVVPNLQKLNECKISGPDFRVPIPHRFGHVVGIQVPDYCNVRWAYSALPDKKRRPVPIAKTGSSKKKYKKSKGKQKAVDDFESDSEPSEPSIEESDEDESKSSHTTTETEEVEGEFGDAGEEVET